MDFIDRPKSKTLKYLELKIKATIIFIFNVLIFYISDDRWSL
jgi:hypothetical protein